MTEIIKTCYLYPD